MEKLLALAMLAVGAQAVTIKSKAESLSDAIENHEFLDHEIHSFGNCECGVAATPRSPQKQSQKAFFFAGEKCTHGVKLGARLSLHTYKNLTIKHSSKQGALNCEPTEMPGIVDCKFSLSAGERAGWVTSEIASNNFGVWTPLVEVLEPEKLAAEVITTGLDDAKVQEQRSYKTNGSATALLGKTYCKYKTASHEKPEGTYYAAQSLSECRCYEGLNAFNPFSKETCYNGVEFEGVMIGLKFKKGVHPDYNIPFYLKEEPLISEETSWAPMEIDTRVYGERDYSGMLVQLYTPASWSEKAWINTG